MQDERTEIGAIEDAPRVSPPFCASAREQAGAVLAYPLACCFVFALFGGKSLWAALFLPGFIALTIFLQPEASGAKERWVWLVCAGLNALGITLGRGAVWDGARWPMLVFALWWAAARCGWLTETQSGAMLPLDAWNIYGAVPFVNILLQLRCIGAGLSGDGRRKRTWTPETLLFTLLAALASLILLGMAVALLMQADEGFSLLTRALSERISGCISEETVGRLILALPFSAWLFGALAGLKRTPPEVLSDRGAALRAWLESLRQVPMAAWTALIWVFCLVYAAFFTVQAQYMFGAFCRKLPEGFIVSEYARRGFFELCWVMVINFSLLWLAGHTAQDRADRHKPLLAACLLLAFESLLFAVVAGSKIALYIDCFGFTRLRLQSAWLVAVLAFGWCCAGVSLVMNRRTCRIWMMFGALTQAILMLL